MNFGKWIVVAFVLFAVFIGTLVTVCVRQDISLVSKNYYNDELGYQDQIVRISNANKLNQRPAISKVGKSLHVTFGGDVILEKGELKLFCPSDPEMDKVFALKLDSVGVQSFDVSSAKSGLYKVKLLWGMGGKEYFIERIIYL